ncbi:KxYKxGKxW signal peptide domain-containing protein [Secundilactobacillus silagei]|uniref:KxYKxGKxW signal peptide domain-containing protein n=1 Tax=Secundilactobacillus silagei TaxID=1293415 RepID=UPI0006D1AC85|nr:KxYKxGKxW signal peptide domain-containing protein [Secundilactobacillus silagei]
MKENVRRSARKLQRDERVIKVRRKLYKSGRTWLVASLATAAFGATIIVSGQSANAETVVNTSSTQTQASPIIQDKTVSLDSSSSVQLSTPPETRNQVATSQSNLSATINADSSTQNNLKSNVINADSVSKPTKADSTSTVDSVNLGNANAETLNTAKTKGTQIYQQTGKAQQITAVAAAASGTLGTSPYEIDDDGAMAIQAGKVNKSIYTIGSGNANAIKTISLADGVSAEIDGGYGALFGNLLMQSLSMSIT